MKTREEILRLYQQHFGNNHEAGVYDAGVADGRAVRDVLDTPKIKPTTPPFVPMKPTPTVAPTGPTSTVIGATTPGKFQPR